MKRRHNTWTSDSWALHASEGEGVGLNCRASNVGAQQSRLICRRLNCRYTLWRILRIAHYFNLSLVTRVFIVWERIFVFVSILFSSPYRKLCLMWVRENNNVMSKTYKNVNNSDTKHPFLAPILTSTLLTLLLYPSTKFLIREKVGISL